MDSKQQAKYKHFKRNRAVMMNNQMMKINNNNSMRINSFNGNNIEILKLCKHILNSHILPAFI